MFRLLLGLILTAGLLCGCSQSAEDSVRASVSEDDDSAVIDDDQDADDDTDDDVDDDLDDDLDDDTSDDDTSDDDADDDTIDCIEPSPGMTLQTNDTIQLCPGEYEIPAGSQPAITVAGDHVTLLAEGVTLIGDGTDYSKGLQIDEAADVFVQGLGLSNYGYGVWGSGDGVTLETITVEDSRQSHEKSPGKARSSKTEIGRAHV